jgi:hypothetical protein
MKTHRPLKTVLLLIGLVALSIGVFWLGGDFREDRNIAKDLRSQSKFAQLEFMLLAYHDKYGVFPPTKYQPVAGGPIHSWRVLLGSRTSLNLTERYSKYDHSQEWNSPNNLQVFSNMPYFNYFRLADDDSDISNYLAIGEDDEWPAKKPLRSRLITKGKDRFLIVEDPDSQIHWMEPKH